MSAFDRKVLEWLNDADLPDKSKKVVLDRTAAGIKTYKALIDSDARIGDAVNVDLNLEDVVARAGRRLQDGQTPICQLQTTNAVPKLALRPSSSRPGSRAPSARAGTARSAVPSGAASVAASSPRSQRSARPATASARAAMVSKPTPIPKRRPAAARPVLAKA